MEGIPGQTSENWQMYQTIKETIDLSTSDHRYYIPNKSGSQKEITVITSRIKVDLKKRSQILHPE
jgi:hypothetical protein